MSYPKISVAMGTYNGAKYLKEQLDSIAAQHIKPYELVICDDGSSDKSLIIAEQFAVKAPFPVKIYKNTTNIGFANNFLKAASLCNGEWIAFCDQDDVWLPHKIETVAETILRGSNEIILIVHAAHIVSYDLTTTGRKLPNIVINHRKRRNQRFGFSVFPGFTTVFKSELINKVDWSSRPSDWTPHFGRLTHDRWIAHLANILGDSIMISEPLALYRRHEDAVTGTCERKSINNHIALSKEVGYEHYAYLAGVAREFSKNLVENSISTSVKDSQWGERLREGANKYQILSEIYLARSHIYQCSKCIERISLLLKLLMRGGYIGKPFYSLGVKSFLKDLHLCFFKSGTVR